MPDKRGFIAVQRSVWDHNMFPDETMSQREAWLWMLNEAVWKDCSVKTNNGPVHLSRGQLSFSIRFMAKKFHWSINKVRRFLARLSDGLMIVSTSNTSVNSGQLVITICNYNKYQDGKNPSDTEVNTDVNTGANTGTNTKKKNLTNKTIDTDDAGAGKDFDFRNALILCRKEAIGCLAEASVNLLVEAELRNWIGNGCDFEGDILPAIRGVAARSQGKNIQSWSYFTQAVYSSKDKRLAPPPDVTSSNSVSYTHLTLPTIYSV